MTQVRVDPDGIEIAMRDGESLIEAAWRLGYDWPTTCYGQAECTACNVEVIAGAEHASAVGDDEAAALARLGPSKPGVRLACRVRFDGDAIVRKRGVRQRAVPNPGVPNRAVPNPGVPNRAVPNPGVPNPGVPNRAVPNPGIPSRAVPNRDVPDQGVPPRSA